LILEQREVEALDVAGDDLIYKVISLDVDDALRGVVAPMRISPQMNLPRLFACVEGTRSSRGSNAWR